jgi:excinuclease ABC subunit C
MFEEAEVIRHKIVLLERFKGKSTIVNPRISHVDVVSMLDEENFAYINFLKIVNGSIVQAHNVEIHKVLQEDKRELLGYILFELRERFKSTAPEIIVPFLPGISLQGVTFTVPVRGDKKKLLDLSARNAASYRNDKAALRVKDKWSDMELTVMTTLQHDLRLKKIPMHIECFDNSNLQGTDPVASCVVFRSTRPSKSDYRRFNIKHVEGPNDYASMEEVIERRYKRLKEAGEALPDLIIVDGGKGQLNAAVNKLRQLQVYDQVAVLGIAKRLEEIYLPDDPVPLYLDKNSASLKLIQRIRDEAHRFGLSFHRKKRSSSQLQHSFSNIPGIGEKTAEKLLREIPETKVIKNMSMDELAKIVGKRAASILKSYFERN